MGFFSGEVSSGKIDESVKRARFGMGGGESAE